MPIADIEAGTIQRLGAHTDFSSITILLQEEQGGLEIESKGKFIYVDQVPGTFVLNIGDIFQVWSNSKYFPGLTFLSRAFSKSGPTEYLRSTLHRVNLPPDEQAGVQSSANEGTKRMTRPRYSIPIFSKPKWDAVLEPMPGYEGGGWKRQTFSEFYHEQATKVLKDV